MKFIVTLFCVSLFCSKLSESVSFSDEHGGPIWPVNQNEPAQYRNTFTQTQNRNPIINPSFQNDNFRGNIGNQGRHNYNNYAYNNPLPSVNFPDDSGQRLNSYPSGIDATQVGLNDNQYRNQNWQPQNQYNILAASGVVAEQEIPRITPAQLVQSKFVRPGISYPTREQYHQYPLETNYDNNRFHANPAHRAALKSGPHYNRVPVLTHHPADNAGNNNFRIHYGSSNSAPIYNNDGSFMTDGYNNNNENNSPALSDTFATKSENNKGNAYNYRHDYTNNLSPNNADIQSHVPTDTVIANLDKHKYTDKLQTTSQNETFDDINLSGLDLNNLDKMHIKNLLERSGKRYLIVHKNKTVTMTNTLNSNTGNYKQYQVVHVKGSAGANDETRNNGVDTTQAPTYVPSDTVPLLAPVNAKTIPTPLNENLQDKNNYLNQNYPQNNNYPQSIPPSENYLPNSNSPLSILSNENYPTNNNDPANKSDDGSFSTTLSPVVSPILLKNNTSPITLVPNTLDSDDKSFVQTTTDSLAIVTSISVDDITTLSPIVLATDSVSNVATTASAVQISNTVDTITYAYNQDDSRNDTTKSSTNTSILDIVPTYSTTTGSPSSPVSIDNSSNDNKTITIVNNYNNILDTVTYAYKPQDDTKNDTTESSTNASILDNVQTYTTAVSPISSVSTDKSSNDDKTINIVNYNNNTKSISVTAINQDNSRNNDTQIASYSSITNTDVPAKSDDNSPVTTGPFVQIDVNTGDTSTTSGDNTLESEIGLNITVSTSEDSEGDIITISVEVSKSTDNAGPSIDGVKVDTDTQSKSGDSPSNPSDCNKNQTNNDDGQGKNIEIDFANIQGEPTVWIRTSNQDIIEKLTSQDNALCDVVYILNMLSPPIVHIDKHTTEYCNGTVVVELKETTWKNKDDPSPTVRVTTQVIQP